MKKIICAVALVLTCTNVFADSGCNADSVKADIIKEINTLMNLPGVTEAISNIKLAGPDMQTIGNNDPYYETLYSYHISYTGSGPNVGEWDMVGAYQVNSKTCKVILDTSESVDPLNQ